MRYLKSIREFIKKHELLCLFLLFYTIYNLNFRPIPSGDTMPASLLPFNILENHTLYLDKFYPYLKSEFNPVYFVVETRGHYLSYYPIVTPILITPLYVIPYILLKLTHYPIDMFNPGFVSIVYMSEKLSASLIAAISGIFVFLFLKHLLNRKTALICAIIYAFATNTWSISSQGLWQQGLVELLLSIILYILIKNENSNSNINYIYLGGLTGLLVFNRPVDCLILLPIIYYIAQSQRKNIISYLIAALLSGFPFALYNFYYFNNLFGGYGNLLSQFSLSSASFVGFMGLLISPSRGLFVYSPILILSLFGFLKISRISNMKFKNLLKLFVFSILIQVTVYSCFRVWWSGWSYGPRFLIGMLPILTLFLGLYLTDYVSDKTWGRRGKITTFFIFLLVIISIFVQIVGVFYYPNGNWDGEPDNVDLHPERLWDINDSQITRSLSAGIMGPEKPIKYLQNIWEYWELSYDLVIVESLFWASCPEI